MVDHYCYSRSNSFQAQKLGSFEIAVNKIFVEILKFKMAKNESMRKMNQFSGFAYFRGCLYNVHRKLEFKMADRRWRVKISLHEAILFNFEN